MAVLRDLLVDTRDGEWGMGEDSPDAQAMAVIRGTDFEDVRVARFCGVPQRFLLKHHAERKRLRPWDIVIETAGGSKDRPTGRTLLIKPSTIAHFQDNVTCASFARFLRIDREKANPAFVFWLLQHLYHSQALRQFNTQHTGVARFQFTTFANSLSLELPAMEAQIRIASILSAYDDLIENNTRRIAILEEIARRLYEEWFIQFRFPGYELAQFSDTEIGRVPKRWSVASLDQAIVLQRGFDLPTARREPGPYPVVAATGQHGVHKEAKVKGPGVVTGRSGTLGTVTYIESDFWPLNTTLWVKEYRSVSPRYAFFLLSYLRLRDHNAGAAVPTLNRNDVHRLRIAVPPKELVDRFDNLAEPIFHLKSNICSSIDALRAAQDLLLAKLVSGEIDVSAAPTAAEVAAV